MPVDRVAAQAYSSFEKAAVITVPKERCSTEPVRISRARRGRCSPTAHQVIELGAFAEAVVVIDHTGDAVARRQRRLPPRRRRQADRRLRPGLGRHAPCTSPQHNALVGRDATFKSRRGHLRRRRRTARPARQLRAARAARPSCSACTSPTRGQHQEHRLFVDHDAPQLQVQRRLQGRAAGRRRARGVDRRRAHPGRGRGHRHLRDEPQPRPHRRRARRLGAEPGDRDRRDRRRRTRLARPAASTTSSCST